MYSCFLVLLRIVQVQFPFCQRCSGQFCPTSANNTFHTQQWMRYAEDYMDTMRKELLAVNHSLSEAAAVALQTWHTVALANQKLGQELGWPPSSLALEYHHGIQRMHHPKHTSHG